MATFTCLEDGDVGRLAAAFGIGSVHAWRAIPAGTINSNFAVRAARGAFFLRINEGKSEADLRYEAAVVEGLAAAGVATPLPRRGQDGEPFARYRDKLASLFPWVEGQHRGRGGVSEADAARVGRALARLHRAGLALPGALQREGIYAFERLVERFEGFRATRDVHLGPAVAALAVEIEWLRWRAARRSAAPRGIIHGDLFRDNVLFTGAGEVVLIDFEQTSGGALVYDLAVCLNDWCYDDDFQPGLIAALVAGYEGERRLGEQERALLYVEARAAAMRFTITRITDVYLPRTGDQSKDFRRYWARLERLRAVGEDAFLGWAGLGRP